MRAPFSWMNDISRRFLSNDYLLNGQTGEARVGYVCQTAGKRLGRMDIADKLYDYMSRGWYSWASPVWSNYGLTRGFPISCFGTYVEDDMRSILRAHVEVGMMSKHGGGTSLFLDPLRSRGSDIKDNGTSAGSVNFARLSETEIDVVSQGSSRRGECAVYWNIEHPDVPEALRKLRQGGEFKKLSWGLCFSNEWMRSLKAGDPQKRELWNDVVKARMKTGYPYMIFIDNANAQAPQEYKDLGLRINCSNLCTEIFLHSSPLESFVCCLSSMNMLHYDEWKDTDAVEVMVYFLDSVMGEFIEKADGEYGYDRAVRFAQRQRALGMGQLGWHSLLHSRMIPFDSMEGRSLAATTSKRIKEQAFAASAKMAAEYGEPEYLKGKGRRHMTLTAIAPTQSSSAILGQVSEGVDALVANFMVKDKQKVKYTYKNPFLMETLAHRGNDTPDVVRSIFEHGGSVAHLDCLTPHEKAVFATLPEISSMSLVQMAAARQPYLCQGQSLNIYVDPATVDLKQYNKVLLAAWELGLKSLYYQKNKPATQDAAPEAIAKVAVADISECKSCEG